MDLNALKVKKETAVFIGLDKKETAVFITSSSWAY